MIETKKERSSVIGCSLEMIRRLAITYASVGYYRRVTKWSLETDTLIVVSRA